MGDERAETYPRLPAEVEGVRFALAGLSTAAGESRLHVVSSGMRPLTDRIAPTWTPGLS
jgi:hypothetical protein